MIGTFVLMKPPFWEQERAVDRSGAGEPKTSPSVAARSGKPA